MIKIRELLAPNNVLINLGLRSGVMSKGLANFDNPSKIHYFLKVSSFRNVFLLPSILPKNERKDSTELLSIVPQVEYQKDISN